MSTKILLSAIISTLKMNPVNLVFKAVGPITVLPDEATAGFPIGRSGVSGAICPLPVNGYVEVETQDLIIDSYFKVLRVGKTR